MTFQEIEKIHARFEIYRSDSGQGTWGSSLSTPEGIREEYKFCKVHLPQSSEPFKGLIADLDKQADAVAVLINGLDSDYWAIVTKDKIITNTTGTHDLSEASLIKHLEGDFYENFDLAFVEEHGEDALIEANEQAYQDSFAE